MSADGVVAATVLGRGPVAVVYAGRLAATGAEVAVKVYPDLFDRDTATRLDRERRALATVAAEPAILAVDAVSEYSGDRSSLITQLCAGSLAGMLTAGALPVSEVLGIGSAVAAALAAAHGAGVVHGGVTPHNVLFRRTGEPVLADFGLALRERFSRDPMHALEYTAPETLRDDTRSMASDLYGLGAVLYAMLTGAPPFPRRTGQAPGERILRVLRDPVAPVQSVPGELSELVAALLAKEAEHRPADAARVAAWFEHVRGGRGAAVPAALHPLSPPAAHPDTDFDSFASRPEVGWPMAPPMPLAPLAEQRPPTGPAGTLGPPPMGSAQPGAVRPAGPPPSSAPAQPGPAAPPPVGTWPGVGRPSPVPQSGTVRPGVAQRPGSLGQKPSGPAQPNAAPADAARAGAGAPQPPAARPGSVLPAALHAESPESASADPVPGAALPDAPRPAAAGPEPVQPETLHTGLPAVALADAARTGAAQLPVARPGPVPPQAPHTGSPQAASAGADQTRAALPDATQPDAPGSGAPQPGAPRPESVLSEIVSGGSGPGVVRGAAPLASPAVGASFEVRAAAPPAAPPAPVGWSGPDGHGPGGAGRTLLYTVGGQVEVREGGGKRRWAVFAGVGVVLVAVGVVVAVLLTGSGQEGAAPPSVVATAPGGSSGSAAPAEVQVAVTEVNDLGDRVQLKWSAEGDLDFAVVVAGENIDTMVLVANRQREMTVPVDQDRKYCFQVRATDSRDVFTSEPVSVRGAECAL